MKHTLSRLFAFFGAFALLTSSLFAGEFFIRNGDRVVFLGDSITEQRLYTTYIETYALTRHPEWKLWFRNVGWGGDTSWLRQRAHPNEGQLFAANPDEQQKMVSDAVERGLARDVLPLKPTVVTVKFGMNDHSYQAFREDIFGAYVRSQTKIAEVLKANGARVAFLTSQPIEDKRPDPDKDVRNQSLRKFSDGLKEVAAKTGSTFVDQFDPYLTIMMKERAAKPDAFIGGGDAVHPGPAGHTIMAWAVLKGLGASPIVSAAEINAKTIKVASALNCRIENLSSQDGSIRFERLDESLPMPIDPRATPALKIAPILQDLDQYELKVSGLATGSYALTIDGEEAGRFTAEQLAAGCNLANTPSPVTAQAQEILRLVFEKNNVFFTRWRNVQLYDLPGWAKSPEVEAKRNAELARLDSEISTFESRIDTARKPKSHRFELKKAGD